MRYLFVSQLIIIGLLTQSPFLGFSQKLQCDENLKFEWKEDLKVAYQHYLECTNPPDGYFLIVDFYRMDTLNNFRINYSSELFELFYKTPDCYVLDSGILVYLYTKNHEKRKTDYFRETLLEITAVSFGFPTIKVDWQKDSIISISGSIIGPAGWFDPPYYDYTMHNGKILLIEEFYEMYYPDTSLPLGIPVHRWRIPQE